MTKIIGVLLLLWEPLNFALEALAVLPTIQYRGVLPAVELGAHGAVAAWCAAAGTALLNDRSFARRLALTAIGVAALRSLQSLYWSVLPHNSAPGDETFATAAVLVIAAIMVWLLSRAENSFGKRSHKAPLISP